MKTFALETHDVYRGKEKLLICSKPGVQKFSKKKNIGGVTNFRHRVADIRQVPH